VESLGAEEGYRGVDQFYELAESIKPRALVVWLIKSLGAGIGPYRYCCSSKLKSKRLGERMPPASEAVVVYETASEDFRDLTATSSAAAANATSNYAMSSQYAHNNQRQEAILPPATQTTYQCCSGRVDSPVSGTERLVVGQACA
jgi:hypothetical protein